MYSRLLNISQNYPKSFFLFGPRGSGKTSWLKENFKEALYFDLLDADTYFNFQRNPKYFSRFIPENYQGWIIIDEVQKLPPLLDEVHRLIESKRYRFILTGSSARKLRHKGVNLLAGRAIRYNMYPLTAVELGDDFDIKQALRYGQLPAITTEPDPQKYLNTYVGTYLKEEVQQESLVRSLETFTRFLSVASFSQGSLVNMSAIAREVGISQKIIRNYFEILEDLLLARTVNIFNRRAKRALSMHPKFYFFDVGVYRTLRPLGPLDAVQEIDGIAAESLFLQNLLAINDYLELGYTLYYWRTKHGTEVDFIVYGEQGLKAFEIKIKSYIDHKDLYGLRAFKVDYPEAECYLIYAGHLKQYIGDVTLIPMEEALKTLPALLRKQANS
jgi:predicted AAA+ superfamily ATPase